jgi:hypothetical protein
MHGIPSHGGRYTKPLSMPASTVGLFNLQVCVASSLCRLWSGLVCQPTERVAPRSTSAPMLLNIQRPVATKPSPTHENMHSAGSSCPDALLHVPIVCLLLVHMHLYECSVDPLRAPHHPLLVEAKSTRCGQGAPRVAIDALSHVS